MCVVVHMCFIGAECGQQAGKQEKSMSIGSVRNPEEDSIIVVICVSCVVCEE